MPELPDVVVYLDALRGLIGGREIKKIHLRSPFVVRSVEPDLFQAEGQTVVDFHRLGKRIVWELTGDLFLVFHLMIAGRFHWKKPNAKPRGKIDLAAFAFDNGTLMLTEASPKKRAALYAVRGEENLAPHRRDGLEVLDCDLSAFRAALTRENYTLKRALTDPRLFSGIGNAYSDEILHAARLSPVKWTTRLDDEEIARLYDAARRTLQTWIARLGAAAADSFPEKVTAFRPEMAAHGKFGRPCPVCGAAIARIVYADNETNYCPRCQTGGKLLADRSLSRLLKNDWPRTLEELEDDAP